MEGKQYQDREWLFEKYVVEGMSQSDIAELFDTQASTISYWMDKHDIDVRDRSESAKLAQGIEDRRCEDRDWLYQKYVVEGRSTLEIADICGVHFDTVNKYLHENDIKVRGISEALEVSDRVGAMSGRDHPRWVEYCTYMWDGGYEYWTTTVDGDRHYVPVHRLLAVSEFGFEAVKGKDVHHKNGFRLDNRPENIELLSRSDHVKLHKNNNL